MSKSVTVITTYYEGKKYLHSLCSMMRRNFDAIRQDDITFEYVIVNDSPWDEISIPEEFADIDIKVYNNTSNVGIHQSRINGVRVSNGEYVLILDQDDAIEDSYLKNQLAHIGDADIVVCNGYKELKDRNKVIYRDALKFSLVKIPSVYLKAANQIVSPGQCLIKKDSIPKEWLDFTMGKNGSDDLFLWLLCFAKKRKFAINSQKLYRHNQVGSNLSNDLKKMTDSDIEMCNIAAKYHLLPDDYIKSRLRMCDFVKETGYTQKLTISSILKFPDIALAKIFAYLA